eukprot:CAMPEP_0117458790 /NCGR_PEP_ID=MMETSP0784-20121206/1124_1 /TAXON_ID=39447 /ORGANISM="" /LENGTH=661 /DNA_ID=CAMNT_0005252343 /DNA_START=37 /DNA_END=2022 /DNA_ORIENTATION=+
MGNSPCSIDTRSGVEELDLEDDRGNDPVVEVTGNNMPPPQRLDLEAIHAERSLIAKRHAGDAVEGTLANGVDEAHQMMPARSAATEKDGCASVPTDALGEAQALLVTERVEAERKTWLRELREKERREKAEEFNHVLDETRRMARVARSGVMGGWSRPANRYGTEPELPEFQKGVHVPVIGLINPMSGAAAGADVLEACRRTAYYQDRFFNIVDVVKGRCRGGLLDVFRIELTAAKEEAKLLGTRPRLISGGGDGTASFALFIVFLALKADESRVDDGIEDMGSGFIWTDDEVADYFPALAQMPLGSANDFGHTLGWGQRYPGQGSNWRAAQKALYRWFAAVIEPAARVANFDIWGIMPAPGTSRCDFKVCELTGERGWNPKKQVDGLRRLTMKLAGTPVPFIVCLYFSSGFAAYMVARFQINRRKTPFTNKLEYVRQALGITLESTPPQLGTGLSGVNINCDDAAYFPPREDARDSGRNYREVGFFNINWQANMIHGADRAPLASRMLRLRREPAKFNDGHVDMYRMKMRSIFKNPGVHFQTDKKKEMTLKYDGKLGQGIFFQWDGESRFAFSPSGQPFSIHVRKVMNVPVVLGPMFDATVVGVPNNGQDVKFQFCGSGPEEQEAVKRRVMKYVSGELDEELNATFEDLAIAGLVESAHA